MNYYKSRLGHAKSICSFSGPRAWKLAALQKSYISRDLKLKEKEEFVWFFGHEYNYD